MSVVATVEVAAEEVALGATLAADPDLTVCLESLVPLGDRFVPYVRVEADTVEDVEVALRAATDVASFAVVDAVGGEVLVRVEWAAGRDGFLDALVETGATVLAGVGRAGAWTMQLRFEDRDDLSAFFNRCVDSDVSLDVRRVDDHSRPAEVSLRSHVTDAQYETLVTALERGYFEVPRRVDLVDLAAEVGVSDAAVSQRLRRGIASLLAASLADTGVVSGRGGDREESATSR